jgi:uncharacterized protein YoxC
VIVWRDVFLGVIAVATLLIAVGQIAIMVAAGRMARRLEQAVEQLERDVKPLFGHLNAIGRDASRAAALAAAQVDRADRLFTDIAARVDYTLNTVQASIRVPVREGRALMSAFRAAVQAIRELRRNGPTRQGRGEEEDALFI